MAVATVSYFRSLGYPIEEAELLVQRSYEVQEGGVMSDQNYFRSMGMPVELASNMAAVTRLDPAEGGDALPENSLSFQFTPEAGEAPVTASVPGILEGDVVVGAYVTDGEDFDRRGPTSYNVVGDGLVEENGEDWSMGGDYGKLHTIFVYREPA